MVLCAITGGSCFSTVLCAFPAGSCLSMVSPAPAENLQGTAPAERQPLPHRLPLRSIPPAARRLRAPPIHEGHGRPRSVRKSSRLRWKHHLPSCSCSQARRQPHPAQVRQIASQTEVLPRRMRFVAGRRHCSSKSPRCDPVDKCFQRSRQLFRTDRGRPCPREWEGARKRSAAGGMERSGSLCGRACRSAEAAPLATMGQCRCVEAKANCVWCA